MEEMILVEVEADQPDDERGRRHREKEPQKGRRTLFHGPRVSVLDG
jgi:hypothetical protein